MGFFTNFNNDYNFSENFANNSASNYIMDMPRTASATLQDAAQKLARIPRAELERLYIKDAQTFKMVNMYKRLLLQAGYRIVSDNKTNQKQYDDFFKNIGRVGLHYKLEQLLERVINDCCVFGHAYLEKIYDESGTYLLDLKPIDAKLVDYVRDMRDMMMTDKEQNPLGYTMYVGYYTDAISDRFPSGAKVLPSFIFLKPERIVNFILNPIGNGFEGMGIVESAYEQITRKMNIEASASNAIFNASESLIYAVCGDAQRNPSKPLMDATMNTLKNFTTNKRAVFSYPTDIKSLPIEQSPQVNEMLKYLRTEQASAAGFSLSMAIGTGESNNKSTMNTERKDVNTQLNSVAQNIATQFSSKILDELYRINNYGSKAVMIWNNVSVEDRGDVVPMLKTLFDMGALTVEEVRNYAKNVFDLETDDEEWKKAQKEIQSQIERLPNFPNQTDKGDNTTNPLQTKKNITKSKDKYEDIRQ